MRRRALIVALAVVPVLAAFIVLQRPPHYAGQPVEPAQVAPDLVLSGSGATRVSLARPGRRLTLVSFGYTTCPDVCPTTLSDWRRVRATLGADTSRVRFVWVSADWRHDSPAQAGEFAARFDPGFLGVTADSLTLLRILPVFQAIAHYGPNEAGGPTVFAHSAQTYLLDETGRITLQYEFASQPAEIAKDIRTLARARGLGRE